jgi:uncharacterized protein
MVLPDVNVLLYAFRSDLVEHAVARRWLDGVVSGNAMFGLSPLVLSAVIRVSTNRLAFATPSTLDEAFGFCHDLFGQPHCQVVAPGNRHWDIFTGLCVDTATVGRRVTDAWFAALAIEWGCQWVSFDRDFARFPGLDWHRLAIPA